MRYVKIVRVSREQGLRKFLGCLGHELIVISDKDGQDSVFERELNEVRSLSDQHVASIYPPEIAYALALTGALL